jgi:predicted ferric reductase
MESIMTSKSSEEPEYQSTFNAQSFLLILLAMAAGMLLAVTLMPTWLPNLTASLIGSDPKAYWYLSRGSAFVAYGLFWLSMAFGLLVTNKMARLWPGAPAAFAIHEFVSLLGLSFAMFHAIILLGDRYINFSVAQILIPFASSGFKPLWVGLGQLGFYVLILVTFSFYVRKSIGHATWRVIHYVSFIAFLFALVHGITSGTDTGAVWAQWMYWLTGTSLLFMLMYRIVAKVTASSELKAKRIAAQNRSMAENRERNINSIS